MLKIIRVIGRSMEPTIMPEDYVMITSRPLRKRQLKQGDICVFKTKSFGTMIKRIDTCDNKSLVAFFKGENPMSIATEQIGEIPYDDILGVVFKVISKRK